MSDTERLPGISDTERASKELSADDDGKAKAPRELGPGDSVGRYQIVSLLGAGGMGRVFTAFDSQLGRVVALKVIHPEMRAQTARNRSRLLREAQALAKLQHPNVVTVHDVGIQREQLFIAMEAVAGVTLAAWLASKPRSWRAIRDVFIQAGRGLAAAHEAGIVHRDFKPSNVIVAADRVVVVDFGVARLEKDAGDEPPAPPERPSILDVNLTLTGERVGTPRYMAPEQHAGAPVTARTDQFSFAATLWAAFYGGDTPFPGINSDEVLERMLRGPAAPAVRTVPARIHAALLRALAFQPDGRWPSMHELLRELAHDPATRRRRIFGVGAALVAAVAIPLAFFAGGRGLRDVCAQPTTTVWDDAARASVRSAFLGTGVADAPERFDRIDRAISGRVGSWAGLHADACSATEIRHEQPAAVLEARMACLARGQDQIAAFVDALRSVDGAQLDHAADEAGRVGELEACADVPAVAAVVRPPRNPRLAASIAELEHDVARVEAVAQAGNLEHAFAATPALVERASQLGHPPLLARVLYDSGQLACVAGDPRNGVADLYAAANAAALAHDDYAATKIYTLLTLCVGNRDASFGTGETLSKVAEASLLRAGNPPELRARLYEAEWTIRLRSDDVVNGLVYAELVRLSYQRLYGEESAEYGRALGELALSLHNIGAFREARAAYERSAFLIERALGPSHPTAVKNRVYLGGLEMELGDVEAARETLEHALAVQPMVEDATGAGIMKSLAMVYDGIGRFDDALELAQRALKQDRRLRRPDHPDVTFDLFAMCRIALDRHDLAEAQARCDEALALRLGNRFPNPYDIAESRALAAELACKLRDFAKARTLIDQALAAHRKLGPRGYRIADDKLVLGRILLDSGGAAEARPVLEDALAIHERVRNPDAAEVVRTQTLLAEALLATGRSEAAAAMAGRAVDAANGRRLRADVDAEAHFALARALGEKDRPRALELARRARERLRGYPAPDEASRIDRWLAGR